MKSLLVLLVAVVLGLRVGCRDPVSLCGAYAQGDIIIGILSSVHWEVKDLQPWILPDLSSCVDLDLISFVQALAAIHTIDTINDSGFLPGIRLGYLMCDPCGYATKALYCVQNMYSNFNSSLKAFLGERYSELTIPAAKLISLYTIPQISCTASAAALSDKLRYSSFLRVIPSDIYQTWAFVKLMKHFRWQWIGVVTLDDDYGRGFFENFLPHAVAEEVCVAFHEVISYYHNMKQHIKEVASHIRSSTAKVVLLILRPEMVEMLFQEIIESNMERIWIASDAWSTTRYLMKMKDIDKVGEIFGFNFLTGNIPGFEDYLQNLSAGPGVRNDFIKEYKELRFNCSPEEPSEHTSPVACSVTDPQEANDDYLLQTVDLTEAYGQRVAVYAIAHAIKKLLQCNDTTCSGDTDFSPVKLVDVLRNVSFTLDGQNHSFNENGDFDNGYDIMMWKRTGAERVPEVAGKFLIKSKKVEIYEHKIPWSNDTVPLSRCSEPCPPGTEKKMSDISCCYNCTNCHEGYYSIEWDQATCLKCPDGLWSLSGSRECQKWKIWFLEWSDGYSIVVMIGTLTGELLLVSSFIVFLLHRERNIVQNILVVSCLMKLGLMVSFGSVITFLGSPNVHLCRAQQTMYGLGFTLCVSCILVKACRAFRDFMSYDPGRQRVLRKFDKPFVIIGLATSIQALICIFWLIFDPVGIEQLPSTSQPLTQNRLCTQGSMYGFGAMHVYIGLLALICFLLAFKAKDEETDPIVFSMLLYLLTWLCFIPVFITQHELRPIIQISAIMVSNYGVIFCHFTPKWIKIFSEKSKTPPSTIPPVSETETSVDSPGAETDSGFYFRRSFSESISISSFSPSRLSDAASETSMSDNLQVPEDQSTSVRSRTPSSQRQRSL